MKKLVLFEFIGRISELLWGLKQSCWSFWVGKEVFHTGGGLFCGVGLACKLFDLQTLRETWLLSSLAHTHWWSSLDETANSQRRLPNHQPRKNLHPTKTPPRNPPPPRKKKKKIFSGPKDPTNLPNLVFFSQESANKSPKHQNTTPPIRMSICLFPQEKKIGENTINHTDLFLFLQETH